MAISAIQLAEGLSRAVAKEPKKEKTIVKQFISYLEEKHLIGLLPSVVSHMKRKEQEQKLQESVQITVAHDIDKKLIEHLKKYVGADKDTEVVVTVDAEVEGGFVATYNNKIFDGTVQSQLSKAEQLLTQGNA